MRLSLLLPTCLLIVLVPSTAVIGWLQAQPIEPVALPSPGAVATMPATTEASGPAGCWHVVQPGENLRSIARHYYGSGRMWRTVQLANDTDISPAPGVRVWVPGHVPQLP